MCYYCKKDNITSLKKHYRFCDQYQKYERKSVKSMQQRFFSKKKKKIAGIQTSPVNNKKCNVSKKKVSLKKEI